jgi:hypothetical protein
MERNVRMLRTEMPDLLVRFPGGKGTQNCADHAAYLKISIWRV